MTATPQTIAVADGTDPYWLALLRRIGVATSRLDGATRASSALLFLPEETGSRDPALCRLVEHLHAAGAPILAGRSWGARLGIRLPGSGDLGLAPQPAAGQRRSQPAPLLVLPLPTARQLLREDHGLAELRGPDGLCVHEFVAKADHGGLRRCIAEGLRSLQFAAGRPFAFLAHHPAGHRQTLAIRIDADSFDAAATASTLASLRAAGLRATWCIDVERHQLRGGMATLATIAAAGHELQSHAYHHYTYRSPARNRTNLQRSLRELAAVGVHADAVVAPFGSWNPGFAAAVANCGLRWSSEFSRVHDDVPGPLGGTADEPWQVPIHPVCPALLYANGADNNAVERWFLAELRQCQARAEPAVFYGHPIADLERCPELLPKLAAAARQTGGLWQPTLGELHDFYRQRANQQFAVVAAGRDCSGTVTGPAPLVLQTADGTTTQTTGNFTLAAAGGMPRPMVLVPQGFQPRAGRRQTLRHHRLRLARLLREIRS